MRGCSSSNTSQGQSRTGQLVPARKVLWLSSPSCSWCMLHSTQYNTPLREPVEPTTFPTGDDANCVFQQRTGEIQPNQSPKSLASFGPKNREAHQVTLAVLLQAFSTTVAGQTGPLDQVFDAPLVLGNTIKLFFIVFFFLNLSSLFTTCSSAFHYFNRYWSLPHGPRDRRSPPPPPSRTAPTYGVFHLSKKGFSVCSALYDILYPSEEQIRRCDPGQTEMH
ncbi:hypothetical protein BGZ63DRAFT_383288 [Mariannaea sp. PMI_226]|nr:hypothetical protein BGZ63DRAFT_383288 [Mariannaea sp. PMI_226]